MLEDQIRKIKSDFDANIASDKHIISFRAYIKQITDALIKDFTTLSVNEERNWCYIKDNCAGNRKYRDHFNSYLSAYSLDYNKFSILMSLRDKLKYYFHKNQLIEDIRDLSLDLLEIPEFDKVDFRPYIIPYERLVDSSLISTRDR